MDIVPVIQDNIKIQHTILNWPVLTGRLSVSLFDRAAPRREFDVRDSITIAIAIAIIKATTSFDIILQHRSSFLATTGDTIRLCVASARI